MPTTENPESLDDILRSKTPTHSYPENATLDSIIGLRILDFSRMLAGQALAFPDDVLSAIERTGIKSLADPIANQFIEKLRQRASQTPEEIAGTDLTTIAIWLTKWGEYDLDIDTVAQELAQMQAARNVILSVQKEIRNGRQKKEEPEIKSRSFRDQLFINGREIQETIIPEPEWIVQGLIPSGLLLLAGPPKKGKSWFALELALAICSDGYFLSKKTKAGKVWYCALEDPIHRIKSRMEKQKWSGNAADNLTVTLGAEFMKAYKNNSSMLATYIRDAGYTLVILDTFSRAFQVKDWNDIGAVTALTAPLQNAASESGTSILLIDHHRKRGMLGLNDDPIDNIIGSRAKTSVADAIFGLYREPGKPGAKFTVIGRDIEEKTLDLRFDIATGCWQQVSVEESLTDAQRSVLDALQEVGASSITEIAGIVGLNRGQVYQILTSLEARELVERNHNKTWTTKT